MLIYVQLLLSITLLEQHSDAVSAICCADCANFLPVNAKTLFFLHFAVHFAARGLSSAYESNLVKSYHKFKDKSRSNVRIFTRHQLQHFNQTSASCRNLKFKIYQQQNTNQTPSSKCSLNFNFKILTKPCAQSMNKSLAFLPNLSFEICNKLFPTGSSSVTVTTSTSFVLVSSHARVTSIKFAKQELVSESVTRVNNDRTRVR